MNFKRKINCKNAKNELIKLKFGCEIPYYFLKASFDMHIVKK